MVALDWIGSEMKLLESVSRGSVYRGKMRKIRLNGSPILTVRDISALVHRCVKINLLECKRRIGSLYKIWKGD